MKNAIIISWNGWDFRGFDNGEIESRNIKKKLDWAVRNPAEIELLEDHVATIWDSLNTLSHVLPQAGEELPVAEQFTAPQPGEYRNTL